jgi:hypothetical protein
MIFASKYLLSTKNLKFWRNKFFIVYLLCTFFYITFVSKLHQYPCCINFLDFLYITLLRKKIIRINFLRKKNYTVHTTWYKSIKSSIKTATVVSWAHTCDIWFINCLELQIHVLFLYSISLMTCYRNWNNKEKSRIK